MNTITSIITITLGLCIVVFAVAVFGGALYGMFVWYPAHRKRKIDGLKATGMRGEGTILRLSEGALNPNTTTDRAMYTITTIGLEIRVPGIDTYEVDKVFTFPTSNLDWLEVGKEVVVWVDPKEPRNTDKIVMDIK